MHEDSHKKHFLGKRLKTWLVSCKRVLLHLNLYRDGKNDQKSFQLGYVDDGMSNSATLTENFQEWFRAIDALQRLIASLKQTDGNHTPEKLNLESLSVQTYMYHIDRLLVKVREQLYSYQYRVNEIPAQDPKLAEVPFLLVKKAAQQCYITILEISHLLKTTHVKKLYNHRVFIKKVHGLELDASELASAVRSVNQYTYQQETLQQLAYLERTLLENISKPTELQGQMLPYNEQMGLEILSGHKSSVLREKALRVANDFDKTFLLSFVEIYDNLKRCYVVARKSTINETLEHMYSDLERLIDLLSMPDKTEHELVGILSQFYHAIESLRFSTNRDSRCSRHLFEKAKQAKHQMREACLMHEAGIAFLKNIAIRKMDRLRYKIRS